MSKTSVNEKSPRILFMDPLRQLLIIMVWSVHGWNICIWVPSIQRTISRLAGGAQAVVCFFIISGFLITRILMSMKQRQEPVTHFWIRRSARIFPSYYLMLILAALIFAPFFQHAHWGRQWDLITVPKSSWVYLYNLDQENFANAHKGYFYGFLNPIWSLCVEEQWYVFWPVIVMSFTISTVKRLLPVMFAVALAAANYFQFNDPRGAYFHTLPNILNLGAGAMVALYYDQIKRHQTVVRWTLVALGLLALVYYLNVDELTQPGSAHSGQAYIARSLVSLGILLGGLFLIEPVLQKTRHWTRFWKVQQHIGVMTYGLYLYQVLWFPWFDSLAAEMEKGHHPLVGAPLAWAEPIIANYPNLTAAGMITASAVVSYLFLELWCQKLGAIVIRRMVEPVEKISHRTASPPLALAPET